MKTEAESRSEIVVPDQRSSGLVPGSLRIPTIKIKWRALGTWAVRGLVALAVLGVVGWWLTRPAPVQCVQPWRGELRQEVFGTGTLEAKVVIGFSAKMIGKVTEVLVDQGDTVTNGQVLAQLEATDYENSVRVAEAGLKQAQAELSLATLNLDRSRSLLKSKSISQAQFDTDAASKLVAEAKLKSAEAELGFASARRADTQIVSPVSGLVITRDLEVGATVVPGAAIFRVADTSVLWVVAKVDEREVGRLRVGQPGRVVFESNPNAPQPGHVTRLSMETDRVTEEREVDVTLDRLPPNFFLGQKADVYIETERKENVLQIPVGALTTRDGKAGVFIVANGRTRWRPVQVGLKGRNSVEVTSGVDEHELVILNPYASKQPLADGARVVVASAQGNP